MLEFYQRLITGMILCALFVVIYVYAPPIALTLYFATICACVVRTEWQQICPFRMKINRPVELKSFRFPGYDRPQLCWYNVGCFILGLFYIWMPLVLLMYINQTAHYRYLLPVMFVLVVAFDTGSYIFGKLFGKHTIAPTISPGKTWQGLFGGLLCAQAATGMILFYQGKPALSYAAVGVTAVICLLAFCGDLFESYLKRRAGLKDSGSLLPGHGGVLDRLDSILFTSYFVFLARNVLLQIF